MIQNVSLSLLLKLNCVYESLNMCCILHGGGVRKQLLEMGNLIAVTL